MSTEHRKLATFMFTDMVGYSALAQQNEGLALDLLEEQRRLLRRTFSAHDGRELDAIGDGFLVEFASAVDATRCAVAIQQCLAARNAAADPARRIRVRIGLHLGDVVVREGRAQGDGVNIAARIEPLAEPGGICVSEDVARQIANKLEQPLRKLGRGELKNIRLPVDIYRVVLPWQDRRAAIIERLVFMLGQRWTWQRTAAAIVVLLAIGALVWSRGSQGSPTAPDNVRRIAVLPFANLSGDATDEYFADGMTEELISAISTIPDVEVIGRTSVMQYKSKARSVADIGRELNVGTVLEGSVRRDERRVRVAAQLISVQSQTNLWSQQYDRELKGVFAIQSDIAERVARALSVRLAQGERRRIERGSIENVEAHNLYLLGRYEWNKFTRDGAVKSLDYFQQAIAKDPTYARAFGGLSLAYHSLGVLGVEPSSRVIPKAKAAALKALELDDTLGEALGPLAYMRAWYDRDWAGAERDYRRALALGPNDPMIRFGWAIVLEAMGRLDESLVEIKRARDLDPLSMIVNTNVGTVYFNRRQYDQAIKEFQRVLQLDPSFVMARWQLAPAYALKQRYAEAVAEAEAAAGVAKADPVWTMRLGYVYGLAGRRRDALDALERLTQMAGRQYVSPQWVGSIYLGLGEKDKALEYFIKSVETERLEIHMFYKVGPPFDPLRGDPRFHAILKQIGLDS